MAIPKPHEIEPARKGVAEANIEKAWDRPCPYGELETKNDSAEGDRLYYRCQRWRKFNEPPMVKFAECMFVKKAYRLLESWLN